MRDPTAIAYVREANGKRLKLDPFHPGVWCGCEGMTLFIGLRPNASMPDLRAGSYVTITSIDLDNETIDVDAEISGSGLCVWYDDRAKVLPFTGAS